MSNFFLPATWSEERLCQQLWGICFKAIFLRWNACPLWPANTSHLTKQKLEGEPPLWALGQKRCGNDCFIFCSQKTEDPFPWYWYKLQLRVYFPLPWNACRWVQLHLSSSWFKVQKNQPLLLTTGSTKSTQCFAFPLTPPTYVSSKAKKKKVHNDFEFVSECRTEGKGGISRKCRVIDLAGNTGGMFGDIVTHNWNLVS